MTQKVTFFSVELASLGNHLDLLCLDVKQHETLQPELRLVYSRSLVGE